MHSRACLRCSPQEGSYNGNWKGGRVRHKAGYVMVRIPAHPRAPANSGYVFEHILVMEAIVGRYLVAGETVHHRNGIRADNRPENLELWVRAQPPGARVADVVAWAKSVLAVYEPSALAKRDLEPGVVETPS